MKTRFSTGRIDPVYNGSSLHGCAVKKGGEAGEAPTRQKYPFYRPASIQAPEHDY